jgi:hypothetical protein
MQKSLITYLAIFLLYQSMFINVNILFEFSELVEDYQVHKSKYGDSFYTFFSKHFGDLKESHKEQHKEEHKHHNHPIQNDIGPNVQEVYVLQYVNFNMQNSIEVISKSNNFGYADPFSTFEKQKIFQPPKLT